MASELAEIRDFADQSLVRLLQIPEEPCVVAAQIEWFALIFSRFQRVLQL
jgi:hypothetical protein